MLSPQFWNIFKDTFFKSYGSILKVCFPTDTIHEHFGISNDVSMYFKIWVNFI